MEFTSMDIFWILITIAGIFAIVGFVFRKILKLALAVAIILTISGIGFGWLPEQMEKVKNGETTVNEVVGEAGEIVSNRINEGKDFVENNKEGWLDGFTSAWEKVLCSINNNCEELPEETPENPDTEENN